MKILLVSMLGVVFLGGCTHQKAAFTWYHPHGGEYLFAYDRENCTEAVLAQNLSLGTDTDGPFFQCMRKRGYALFVADRGTVPGEDVVLETTSERVRDSGFLANGE